MHESTRGWWLGVLVLVTAAAHLSPAAGRRDMKAAAARMIAAAEGGLAPVYEPLAKEIAATLDLTEFQKRSVQSVATGDGNPAETQGVFVNHGLAGPNFHRLLTSGFQALSAGQKTSAEQAADLQAAWEEDNS